VALGPTPSQTAGPFLSIGLLGRIGPELIAPGSPEAIRVEGLVLDGAGEPVADALVELWQADAQGRYRGGDAGFSGFGRSDTVADGRFGFVTLKPGRVAAPGGGLQAPHLNLGIFARGLLKRLCTRMYFPDEPEANALDPTLCALEPGARARLLAVPQPDGSLRFDIRLQGGDQTVFFAL
jgi:protocatechuate 3,4-dioxygenase alpha subunit